MDRLDEEIIRLCRQFAACCTDVESREDALALKMRLEKLCRIAREGMNIGVPGLLLALLDAYEVTRDEGMLQEVLDVVSGNIGRLEVSAESVKLLAYCYYYVEEEECAVKAWEMLKELEKRGEDVVEVEKVLEELTDLAMKAR